MGDSSLGSINDRSQEPDSNAPIHHPDISREQLSGTYIAGRRTKSRRIDDKLEEIGSR